MRPTIARINLKALRHNLKKIRAAVGQSVGIIPVVKADAYGHGAVATAWALAEKGIDLMAVACLEEALDLSDAGVPARFLLLGGLYDEKYLFEAPPDCIPVVWSEEGISLAASLPSATGRPIEVHLKVNTGMARLGCEPHEIPGIMEVAKNCPQLRITGVMSHLSSAGGDTPEDEAFTRRQVGDFHAICTPFRKGTLRHLAASAAIIKYPESHFDAVRPGLMIYGIWPFEDSSPRGKFSPQDLKPVMSLVSKVAALRKLDEGDPLSYGRTFVSRRPTRVAVIPAGYADGISRHLSNRGQVLIGGVRRNIIGVVTMDYITVDVSDPPQVNLMDEVVLIGRQGNEEITAWDVARWMNSIPYEVTCGISWRVPRMMFDD